MVRTIMTVALVALLAGSALAAPATASHGTVNVNTATAQQLQLLPRVGPSLAKRIIEFREANGPFKSPEELVRVKGIGEKSFARLKAYVSIDGDTTLTEKVKAPRTKKPAGGAAAQPQ